MTPYDFVPTRPLRLLIVLAVLVLIAPGRVDASGSGKQTPAPRAPVTIAFGQESGNIRPFRVTITATGAITLTGPIHLTGGNQTVSRDAMAGLVRLARAEGFPALPGFTSCPGVLPDIATRYINIHTPTWHHRASARGACLDSINQLFAVLMALTHASY